MGQASSAIRRADYQPPKYFTPEIDMQFFLDEGKDGTARLVTKTKVVRNGKHNEPLVLDGEYFDLSSIKINGVEIPEGTDLTQGYMKDEDSLTVQLNDEVVTLEVETIINAKDNGAMTGLYKQGGSYTTQCEAQGFRRMTYAVDRPDNLAKFSTEITYDPAKVTHALSNGDMVDETTLADGRINRRWEDPHLKPTYLFALCGNNFLKVEDSYVTKSGRKVALEVFADKKYEDGLQHSIDSLKNAMKWDEDVWGLEYDLDTYMVVADDFFNMGAMENKGLNVFNPKYMLANPAYANDADYYNVESVIGHEYFHNWTGNRVTVENWLELCLKEGLTVFRDQWFSADMSNPLASRINDVNSLKRAQFPEDSSPLVHAPRMEEAEEMNNIYTSTVYNKGAEVNRMLQLLLGDDGFMTGAALYFKRHDGQAVAVENWVQAHADANNADLDQFMRWYTQGGRPTLKADWSYDDDTGEFVLSLEQDVPVISGVSDGQLRVIPVDFGLMAPDGKEVVAEVISFNQDKAEYRYQAPKGSVPSLLRNFSAPVSLEADYSDDQLIFLAKNDTDMFNRWDAIQKLLENDLVGGINSVQAAGSYRVNPKVMDLFRQTLANASLDDEVKALMLTLPSYDVLAQNFKDRDPELIMAVRDTLEQNIAKSLYQDWVDCYASKADYNKPYEYNMAEKGRRALMNRALYFIGCSENAGAYPLVKAHFSLSNNFNDKQAAYNILLNRDFAASDYQSHVDGFYADLQDYVTGVDHWTSNTAMADQTDMQRFKALTAHPDNKGNISPNRIRALYNGLASNVSLFNAIDGSGYNMLADKIIELESGPEEQRNEQLASRLIDNFSEYKDFRADLSDHMKGALTRIAGASELSANVSEKLKKYLGESEFNTLRAQVKTGTQSSGPQGPQSTAGGTGPC